MDYFGKEDQHKKEQTCQKLSHSHKLNNNDKLNDIVKLFPKSILSTKDRTPVVAWFCTYTPEEIITAGGFIPYRIMGSPITNKSESFFPVNFCPYLKSAWQSLYTNGENEIKAVVFTTSCDGMRRLADTFRRYKSDIPAYVLNVPRKNDPASINYFRDNLKDFVKFIEDIRGKSIARVELQKSIELANKKRGLLYKLENIYKYQTIPINVSTYFKIMKLSMTSKPEIFSDELEKYTANANIYNIIINNTHNIIPDTINTTDTTNTTINNFNVALIGNFINEDKLWDIFSDLNLKIAFQDLCLSTRYFEDLVEIKPNQDLLEAISYRYMNKPSCFRNADLGTKLNKIEKLVRANNIHGIIFITLKFCDNTLYFFPLLKKSLLEKLKIPSLYLEIEYQNFSIGQIKTRIQAFLEMLSQKRKF